MYVREQWIQQEIIQGLNSLLHFWIINSVNQKKIKTMGSLLYVIAVILILAWAISFLGGFYTGGLIHLLLVIAIVVILIRVIQGRNPI